MLTSRTLACLAVLSSVAAADPSPHRPGLEVNVLWPFFPGGIFEMRYVAPVLRADEPAFHGAVVAGAYSDFASRVVRTEEHGKVGNLSVKLGWRQYFVHGLHLEISANAGWRREVMRPNTTVDPIDGFQIRLWFLPGIEYDFSPRFYVNARGAVGLHILRTGPLGEQEKKVVVGGDLNFGVRF